MSANVNIVDPIKGNSTLVRPRFSPGLLLRDDDLRTGVDYTRELSRLLFRSLFGCGVVCGLVVVSKTACNKLILEVGSGIALDCQGDPIHVPRPVPITIDPSCGKEIPETMWVILCRTEKCCAPRSAICACEDDDDAASVCTREHDGFEIRIVSEDPSKCACGCPLTEPRTPTGEKNPSEGCWCVNPCSDCYKDHYAGECSCECSDCDCVILAMLKKVRRSGAKDDNGDKEIGEWKPYHNVRRFVRPVLMRDPQVWKEQNPEVDPCKRPDSKPDTKPKTPKLDEQKPKKPDPGTLTPA